MIADYAPFVERMIQRYEGPYGWDRQDPGGPTKYGVTCFDLAEFMHQQMDSMSRWAPIVQAMTLATAEQIIHDKYAVPCAFDELGIGKDCVVLDTGYNSGPSRSIKIAQTLCRIPVDGVLGPITLAAINAYDPVGFINGLCAARLVFLRGLSIWPRFGKGWTARVYDLQNYSKGLLQPKERLEWKRQRKLLRIPMAFAKGWE